MLYPDLTAEENLLLYAKLYGVADPEHRVIELLDAVGLKHRRLDRVRTFSRGMTQRVSIARALVNDPSVVLLDEPYSGLDPHAMHIFDELIASVREGRTFVMVSHDLDKGLALASHVLVLARGRVVHFGEKDQMSPDEFADLYRTTVGMGVSLMAEEEQRLDVGVPTERSLPQGTCSLCSQRRPSDQECPKAFPKEDYLSESEYRAADRGGTRSCICKAPARGRSTKRCSRRT